MTKINLREQYPDFYKTDYIIEVPDEVAAVMKEHDRLEAAYRRRTYYHKAHYSLDRGDGIEYDALFVSMTPCEPVSYTHLDVYKRQGYARGDKYALQRGCSTKGDAANRCFAGKAVRASAGGRDCGRGRKSTTFLPPGG